MAQKSEAVQSSILFFMATGGFKVSLSSLEQSWERKRKDMVSTLKKEGKRFAAPFPRDQTGVPNEKESLENYTYS